jgi:hypothetical protein
MALYNNPMGALQYLKAAEALAASVGFHHDLTCCGLCRDIQGHVSTQADLLKKYNEAMAEGDLIPASNIASQIRDNTAAWGDAAELYAEKCDTTRSCQDQCAPLLS